MDDTITISLAELRALHSGLERLAATNDGSELTLIVRDRPGMPALWIACRLGDREYALNRDTLTVHEVSSTGVVGPALA